MAAMAAMTDSEKQQNFEFRALKHSSAKAVMAHQLYRRFQALQG